MGEAASEQMVGKERVVLLGAGRVATHLVPALVHAGYCVAQVWSRTETSARDLAERMDIAYTTNLDAVVDDADIYIASVADGALPKVAERVVARVGKAPLYIHTAGSVGMELWQNCGAVHYGILYPLQTFSKEREVDVRKVSFFVEASNEEVMRSIDELAHNLSDKVYCADSIRRARLHVAAVFACNFANAMYDVAHRLLADEKIPFEVVLPLIDETAAKVHTLTPHDAQTGPAVRGDSVVMRSHMAALEAHEDLYTMYDLISNYITKNK